MRKGFGAIRLGLVVSLVILAVLVPGCPQLQGTIRVVATLCGVPWTGNVTYNLTGPGGPITGTSVPASHNVATGAWTCAYVSGGPPGAYLASITPSATQSVPAGGNITFTLNFKLNQDAAIEFRNWSVDGKPLAGDVLEAVPCNIIDAHFTQWVEGCRGYRVTMNETSWLNITQIAGPRGVVVYAVNDWCAVNKTPEAPPKRFQTVSVDNVTVPKGYNVTLVHNVTTWLGVDTQWLLVKGLNYTKAINWFGISVGAYDPDLHPCVLFGLILPGSGNYTFQLIASARVALVGETDVDPTNDHATSHLVWLTVNVP